MIRPTVFTMLPVILAAAVLVSTDAGPAAPQIQPGEFKDKPVSLTLDHAFGLLRQFEVGQSRQPINFVEHEVYKSADDPSASAAMRDRLLTALADSHSTYMCKKLICHNWLPLVAGDEAVPLLVNMLSDAREGLLAVDALQRIEGDASAQALRHAMTTTTGNVQVMAINAVGQRRDDAALPALIELARSSDDQASGPALAALGAIGSKEAAAALLHVRDADSNLLTDAKLLCAQRRLQAGDSQTAAALCGTLTDAGNDARIRMAVLMVLAGARGVDAVPQLRAALGSDDPILAAHAVELLVNLRGADVTAAILALLNDVDGPQLAALLRGLGRRGDRTALDRVASYVSAEDLQVRTAAIDAVGRLGGVSQLELLLRIAASQPGETQRSARAALVGLRDEAVDQALRTLLDESEAPLRAEAIRVAVGRQMISIKPRLLALTKDENPVVRVAACECLRELVTADDYEAVVQLAIDAPSETDRRNAIRLIRVVGRQIDDTNSRAIPLLRAIERADTPVQVALLPLLADVGNNVALQALVERLSSANSAAKDAAVRTLADWPDTAAMSHLLKVLRQSDNPKNRILATRGYLRLLPKAKNAAAAVMEILPLVPDQEKPKLVSGLTRAAPSPAVLRLTMGLLEDPAVQAEAMVAVEQIAAALVEQQPDIVLEAVARLRERFPDDETPHRLAETQRIASALSRDIHQRIDPRIPNGYQLACYMNAGAAGAATDPTGLAVRQLRGAPWRYTPNPQPTTTVAFDAQHVDFEVTGLRSNHRYVLGVTWWDVDDNGRIQSIALALGDEDQWVTVLPKTRPVAYHANQATYAVLHLPIVQQFSEAGRFRVRFQREGPSNAVVSELWLLERPTDGEVLKRIAIVTGDDYPGHRWRETAPELASIFREDSRFEVTIIESPAIFGSSLLDYFDAVVVHFKNYNSRVPTDQAQCAGLEGYVRAGGGLLVAHFGCGAFQEWEGYVNVAGRIWNPHLRGHDPYGPFTVRIIADDHPITKGMADFETTDELYTCLDGDTPIHPLCEATSTVDKRDYPMAFTLQVGEGRVFHCPLGHDVNAFKAKGTRDLYRRAAAWIVGMEPSADPATVRSDGERDD